MDELRHRPDLRPRERRHPAVRAGALRRGVVADHVRRGRRARRRQAGRGHRLHLAGRPPPHRRPPGRRPLARRGGRRHAGRHRVHGVDLRGRVWPSTTRPCRTRPRSGSCSRPRSRRRSAPSSSSAPATRPRRRGPTPIRSRPPADAPRTVFATLRPYRPAWLTADLLAGLTVWAVLVPESLAYASIAGVSPVVGLYAAPPALVLYAAFGSSRYLITGPMSATAALSAAAVADLATGGPANFTAYTSVLALVTGVLALLAGLLRLGFLANFISEPVLKGFIVGLALTIIIGQVPKLLGIPKGERRLLPAALVRARPPRRHRRADGRGRGWRRWPSCSAATGSCLSSPARWSPSCSASSRSTLFDLAAHGVAIVGPIDAGCRASGCPRASGCGPTSGRWRRRPGSCWSASPRASARPSSYAARTGDDIDANRELVGARRGQRRERAVLGHGRQRQPLEDGRRTPRSGGRSQLSSDRLRGADDPDAAVPDVALRGPARSDPRRPSSSPP